MRPRRTPAPLCDRTTAINDDVRLYGPHGAFIENGLLALCGKTPEKLTADFTTASRQLVVQPHRCRDGTIVAVFGHMHTLGQDVPAHARSGHAEVEVLLDIPNWNFDWQMNYGLRRRCT